MLCDSTKGRHQSTSYVASMALFGAVQDYLRYKASQDYDREFEAPLANLESTKRSNAMSRHYDQAPP